MEVELIKATGDFDKIFLDGRLGKGVNIPLLSGRDFKDLLLDKSDIDINLMKLRVRVLGKNVVDSYENVIAYADFYIINGITFDLGDIEGSRYSSDIQDLLKVVYKLSESISQKHRLDISKVKSAILDKIYTDVKYRNNGIATWIHNNTTDIIKYYSGIDISLVVLKSGDFTNESGKNGVNYVDYLNSHYKKLGYNEIDFIKRKLLGVSENIFYKIL